MLTEKQALLRRGTERHKVTIPVQVTAFEETGYVNLSGEASDFSITGLRLVLTRQLEKHAAILLQFNLPYNSQPLRMRALVRHRSGFHHGIEFISVTPTQKEALERTAKILGLLS